jgi:cell division protein FtsL
MSRATVVLMTLLLVASAMALVTARHRARDLFIELEAAQQQAKELEADASRLRIDLGSVAQPAAIEAAARGMGMRPISPDRTVFLPQPGAPAPAAPAR